MKILLATDSYLPSVNGTAYLVHRLAQQLTLRGHKVYIIAPSTTYRNLRYVQEPGFTVFGMRSFKTFVINYPHFRISPMIISVRTIRHVIKDIAPDVIHIHHHFMLGRGVFKVAKKLDIPIIGTNHFLPENVMHYFRIPRLAEKKIKDFTWKQFLGVYNNLDLVVTPTKTAAKIIEDIGIIKKVIPISNGIDLIRFNPNNKGEYLRIKYKIPNKPVMLFVGRLDEEKKVEVIFDAIPEILKEIDVHFVLAGIGMLRKELEKYVKDLKIEKNVTFTGFVKDVDLPSLYCLADVWVISGTAELQSIATLEALASGLPAVAVKSKALPEIIKDGFNGYLFPENNSRILAKRVIKIISNDALKKQMGKNSLKIARLHSISNTVTKYEKIYLKVIKNHRIIDKNKVKPEYKHRLINYSNGLITKFTRSLVN